MSDLFVIDKEKCKKDEICLAVCGPRVIEMGEDGFPESIEEAADFCINCGNCVAACPHGALSLKNMSLNLFTPIDKTKIPSRDQLEQWVRMRRSIRVFKNEPVPRNVLEQLILTARYAPTGGNLQPVHWLVIEKSSKVRHIAGLIIDNWREQIDNDNLPKLEFFRKRFARWVKFWEQGYDTIFRGAPHLIINHGSQDQFTDYACIIAMTTLELMAPAFGLGACWSGYLLDSVKNYQPLVDELNLPEGHVVSGAMFVGYPNIKYQRIPVRNEPVITWK